MNQMSIEQMKEVIEKELSEAQHFINHYKDIDPEATKVP